MDKEFSSLVFRQTSGSIIVSVQPQYLAQQSKPESSAFAWAYTVSIENKSEDSVQIVRRSWRIVDSNGFIQEVEGEGVVGHQPVIKSGEAYEYTSMANLWTRSGLMLGIYEMKDSTGQRFQVSIPAFSLDSPEQLSMPN